jgi:hypothetical protein
MAASNNVRGCQRARRYLSTFKQLDIQNCELWIVEWLNWCCKLLYHFDQVFSHGSQMTLNWALQVFRHRSWAAVNTWLCRFLWNFGPFWPILLTNEQFWCLSWPKFGLWTPSGSVHERHASHPVNSWSKWYSMGKFPACQTWNLVDFYLLSIHQHGAIQLLGSTIIQADTIGSLWQIPGNYQSW